MKDLGIVRIPWSSLEEAAQALTLGLLPDEAEMSFVTVDPVRRTVSLFFTKVGQPVEECQEPPELFTLALGSSVANLLREHAQAKASLDHLRGQVAGLMAFMEGARDMRDLEAVKEALRAAVAR